jgi:N-carbamoyl-L-amino-acid hydrolase
MKTFNIPLENIRTHFAALSKIGNLGPALEDGFLRAGWSDEESMAMEYIRGVAEKAGLSSRHDEVGNLFISTEGTSEEVVQIGSHLDTVPRGGLFDGGAGIVAGLEAILAVRRSGHEVQKAMELVIWRGEESGTFGVGLKGSRMAFAALNPETLGSTFEGRTLEEAMTLQGCNPDFVRNGQATISQDQIDRIAAHFELHIEQANKLENDGVDIGIATSIRSTLSLRVLVHGEAAHSGATPMGLEYRRDANLAMAYMHVRLDELCNRRIDEKLDLVQTIGVINSSSDFNQAHPLVYENGVTKVSPFAYFFLNIRSSSQSFLDTYAADAQNLLRKTAKEFRVKIEIQEIGAYTGTEQMNKDIQELLAASCEAVGATNIFLPCGAGHDCAVVGQQKKSNGTFVPANLLLIPCRNGLSHHPLEYTSDEAVRTGAEVLAEALYRIARFSS